MMAGRALEDSGLLFYNLAQDRACHEGLVEKKAIKLIVHTAHATNLAVVQELCIAALCTLSTSVRASAPSLSHGNFHHQRRQSLTWQWPARHPLLRLCVMLRRWLLACLCSRRRTCSWCTTP